MKNKDIKVSLGIPIYNESLFLKDTIESLLNQSYTNLEIIAIDNCSSDNSYDILKKYSEKDRRLKVFRNDINIGLSNNFNLLIKKSEGKYFSWIGAHDVYDKFYVEKLLSKIIKDDKTSVVFQMCQTSEVIMK